MEMRWLRYTAEGWQAQGHFAHRGGVYVECSDSVLVLQQREGITHDAPWEDVPVEDAFRPVPVPA